MKILIILLTIHFNLIGFGQSTYESPLGFTISFDKTWKRLPRETLQKRIKDAKDYLEFRKDVKIQACFQKVGNAEMDFPYILFKDVYATSSSEEDIKIVEKYFTDQAEFNKVDQQVINGKYTSELKVGTNYYDEQNKILIFTYDLNLSVKGNLAMLIAFSFGKNGSLISYCYSYKDEFKYDQKEFLEIIYSIRDKGMTNSISSYKLKSDIAVKFYNDGKRQSAVGNTSEAIKLYSLAIESYPIEDTYMKSEAYYNRGVNKRNINDFNGAILDYTEAIKLRPDYYKAYNNRGVAKLLIEDYKSAIIDFTLTIGYDKYNTEFTGLALGNRGIAKLSLGQNGCPDLLEANELGNNKVSQIIIQNCK